MKFLGMQTCLLVVLGSASLVSAASMVLDIGQCRKLASESSPDVKVLESEWRAAQEVKSQAVTHWFPQVTVQAFAMAAYNDMVNIETEGGNLPVYDGNPANLATATQFAYMPASNMSLLDEGGGVVATAVQPLYAGGRIQAGNKLASIGESVGKSRLELARQSSVLSAEEKYWTLASLHAKAATLTRHALLLDSMERQVALAVRSGLARQTDLMAVQLRQNEVSNRQARVRDGIALASRDLCRFLAIDCRDSLVIADTLDFGEDPGHLKVVHRQVLDGRTESRMLDQSVEAERWQGRLKMGGLLPQVAVGASVLQLNLPGAGGSQSNAMVFGTVSVPLTGLWEGWHAGRESQERVTVAEARRSDNREQLLLEMDKTWYDLSEAWNDLQYSQTLLNKDDMLLAEARVGFHSGMSTVVALLDAEAKVQEARDRSVDARMNYRVARIAYLKATARFQEI